MESEMDKYRRLVLHATWFLNDTSTLLQNSCIKLNEVAFGYDSSNSAAYNYPWMEADVSQHEPIVNCIIIIIKLIFPGWKLFSVKCRVW